MEDNKNKFEDQKNNPVRKKKIGIIQIIIGILVLAAMYILLPLIIFSIQSTTSFILINY